MSAPLTKAGTNTDERLLSLDFFRGATMFLLIAEGTGLFSILTEPTFDGTWIGALGTQFHHHPWNGLRFWDLIQPFFMFIVGVAMPLSIARRIARGDSNAAILRHTLQRAGLLLLFGWGLYCIGPGRITFRFQNVLAQLSVTYLLAFLVLRRPWWFQLSFSLLLLLLTEVAYRTFWVDGYNQPFTPDQNLGAFVDMKIAGELSGGHWVSLNAIPTAAHTIWGVMAGQLLMSAKPERRKVATLALAGVAAVLLGFALDPETPIIKRIATTSFVICSGGWCLLALAGSYAVIDLWKKQRGVQFFAIVGMNPLFIYLFAEVGGSELLHRIAKPFTMAAFFWTDEIYARLFTSAVVWAMLWYICYWLYRHRIFIRL